MIWLLRVAFFALGLCIGRVDAAVYTVVTAATSTFSTFAACNGVCQAVPIVAGTTGSPASNVTYQVVVTAGGACTVQPIGSNDKVNWVSQGSAIAVTAGSVTGGAAIAATWAYWSATVTTNSGGGQCTVTVSG